MCRCSMTRESRPTSSEPRGSWPYRVRQRDLPVADGDGERELAMVSLAGACAGYGAGRTTFAVAKLREAEAHCCHAAAKFARVGRPLDTQAMETNGYRCSLIRHAMLAEPRLQRRSLEELLSWVDQHIQCHCAPDGRHHVRASHQQGVIDVACRSCGLNF